MERVSCVVVVTLLALHHVPIVSLQNTLTCSYLNSCNSTCANEGNTVECTCMNGGGFIATTVWEGTAFMCPNDQAAANNRITLGHAENFTAIRSVCENIEGRGFNISGDNLTFTSVATVNTTLTLNQLTVECRISGLSGRQTHTLAVGANPVQVNEGPSVTILDNVLHIEFSGAVANELTLNLMSSEFPPDAVQSSSPCGMIQRTGASQWMVTNIPVAGQTCNFSVVTENICGCRSDPSPMTCVLVQVPQSPQFNITHRTYFNNSLSSVQVDITGQVDDNSLCVQDDNIDYTFNFQQESGTTCQTPNTERCGDSTCRLISVSCGGSTDVSLSAMAVNKFGSSSPSNESLISYTNDQFRVVADVSEDDNRVTIYCVINDCTSSATCDIVYVGSERTSSRASGMTSNCLTSSSRNISLDLLDLPTDQEYSYNVTVTIDGALLPVTASGTFQIGVVTTPGGGGGSSAALIGGVVGGFFVLVIIITVIVCVILVVLTVFKKGKSVDTGGGGEDNTDTKVELATYADPRSIEHQEAPGGQEYALVGAKNKPEVSGIVYQDPHTIQHQEAAGGDLYTVVDKPKKSSKKARDPSEDQSAPLYSMPDKSRKNQDKLTYADIDLPRGGAIPPQQNTEYSSLVN